MALPDGRRTATDGWTLLTDRGDFVRWRVAQVERGPVVPVEPRFEHAAHDVGEVSQRFRDLETDEAEAAASSPVETGIRQLASNPPQTAGNCPRCPDSLGRP